jgi:hypothetical protein
MLTYLLQISAKILILIWVVGFLLFGFGLFIHVLLLMAIISLILRFFIVYKKNNKTVKVYQIKYLKGGS